jgi:hypothetical protein
MIHVSTNSRRAVRLVTASMAAALSLTCLSGPAKSQSSSLPAQATRTTSKGTRLTADQQPDLQGIWDFSTMTPMQRPKDLAGKEFFTEQEAADWARQLMARTSLDNRDGGNLANVERGYNEYWLERGIVVKTLRTSLIIDPPDGRLPEKSEEGRQRLAATAALHRGHELDGPESIELPDRCLKLQGSGPPIHPTAYNNFVRIVQSPNSVAILHEMGHEARIIPLDGHPVTTATLPQWNGGSRGHWEGDTLVVETGNFITLTLASPVVFQSYNDITSYRGTNRNLKLTERFRRLDANTLLYQFTVDDPSTFVRPWTAEFTATRAEGPMVEYACHEGNYSMTGVLAGARAEGK